MLYGKITLRMAGIPIAGIVTTFITQSQQKDQINFEIVGVNASQAMTNVYYKGIQEFGVHNSSEFVPNIGLANTYTIDWKSNTIQWSINDVVVRTLNRETSTSPLVCPCTLE